MLCIHLKNNNPYFCLAAEEYFLKNYSEDIFLLWQSHNTVVVGKHQNLLGEVNYPFCIKNNISLARRISGGGTVFHDSGNVNFTYIKNVNSPAEVSFKIFTQPVVDALKKLGVKAENSGRNDLLIEGKKISGNAEHIFKNRVLHHGTLLYNSDLKNLGSSIKVIPGKYRSKAIQSKRSEVVNISSFLTNKSVTSEFVEFLFNFQLKNPKSNFYELTENDEVQIQKLVDEKFTKWDWIYGYSPAYTLRNKSIIENKNLEVELRVKKGIIQETMLGGNNFSEDEKNQLIKSFLGSRHCFYSIQSILKNINTSNKLIFAFF